MKLWLMQRTIYGKEGEVLSVLKPKAFPPDLSRSLLRIDAQQWKVLDKDYEVPDDWKRTGGAPPVVWTEEKIQEVFYPKPAAKPEPAKR